MKKLVALALAAGAAVFLRRQQRSRPTADVWRDATAGSPPPGPPPADVNRTPTVELRERAPQHPN